MIEKGTDHMGIPSLMRLLHLSSPSLPTGGFAYSQGLEWAVESGWIKKGSELESWLGELLDTAVTQVDIPLYARLYHAALARDARRFCHWSSTVLAMRETGEMRSEERNRGRALAAILKNLDVPLMKDPGENEWYAGVVSCQLAGFSLASAVWDIALEPAVSAYVWAWLENQVLAGIKIIPLGQTEGQQVLFRLCCAVPDTVKKGLKITDDGIGCSLPAFAIAGCCHEIQHTRIFRS